MSKNDQIWTVLQYLEWATDFFKQKNIPSARISAEWLLSYVLDLRRLDLYLQFDRPLTKEELNTLRDFTKRRADHEPLQYITGTVDFYNLMLRVAKGVLIPRPETEEMVAVILEENSLKTQLKFVDACTGSGCIALALKSERPLWSGFGFDLSQTAIHLAKANAEQLNLDVHFFQQDIFDASQRQNKEQIDLLVSNPPYVTEAERSLLDREVAFWEPSEALFCLEPLQFYHALLGLAQKWLCTNGQVWLELNPDHAEEVKSLFQGGGFTAEIRPDLSGKMRFLKAVKKTASD